jgi:Ca2+-binding RTX toxin-like protein
MATITYTNFLAVNPGLEEVLDRTPKIGAHTATTYEIINNDGGATNGFVFRLTGTGFTYSNTFGVPTPESGTITGITILDPSSNVVATGDGPFGGTSPSTFFIFDITSAGPLMALDYLLSTSDTLNGSDGSDRLSTFGSPFADTISAGAGDDLLTSRTNASHTLVGGTGNDTFVISKGFGLQVNGSAADGTGGVGETDVVKIAADLTANGLVPTFSAITNIDRLEFDSSLLSSVAVVLTTDQVGPGHLLPVFVGSPAGVPNEIVLVRGGTAAVDVNMSNWTFIDWGRSNQDVGVILTDLPRDDHVVGSINNEAIFAGAGNDVIDGGGGVDTLSGGDGDDTLISGLLAAPGSTLDGGAGTDFLVLDRSASPRSYTLDLTVPTVVSMLGDGTMIINIERLEFHAGSGNDTVAGGAFDDIITGGAGHDVLSGNGGNDNLDGGIGTDVLEGGDGDDTLTGGPGFDTIDGGAGIDTAVFSGLRAAYAITRIGNDFQVTGPDGTDQLTNVEFARFDDLTASLAALTAVSTIPSIDGGSYTDFGGDGRADVFLHNQNGGVAVWQLNGAQVLSATVIGSVGLEWHVEGTADFNGDNRGEVLWRAADGTVMAWQLNGGQIQSSQVIGRVGNEWHIQGTGDLDNNGRDDIVWRADDGTLMLWSMNGPQIQAVQFFGAVGNEWHLVGIGDFGGDGKSDLLWRRTDGTVLEFQMNGTQIASAQVIGRLGLEWRVEGVGDFNGDLRDDILWARNDGTILTFHMNGTQIASAQTIGSRSADWHVYGTGDFGGDGNADILWRNDDGHIDIWQLNGATIASAQTVASLGTDWTLGVHHYDLI